MLDKKEETTRVLVLIRNRKRLPDLLHLAREVSAFGKVEFLFVLSPKISSHDRQLVVAQGFRARIFPNGLPPRFYFRTLLWLTAAHKLVRFSILQKGAESLLVSCLEKLKKLANGLITNTSPDCILSVKDKTSIFDAPILRAAADRKIPIVVPHIFISHLEGLETFADDPDKGFTKPDSRSSGYTRRAFHEFADQLYKGRLFYSPHVTFSYKRFGCLSDFPWLVGHGLSTIVGVDNAHTASLYRQWRVPDEKLKIVGDLSNDALHRAWQQREETRAVLAKRYDLVSEEPVLIIAVPQVVEIGLRTKQQHQETLSHLLAELKSITPNILLSLHPKMDPADYLSLDVAVLKERLFEVLPAADLFMAWYSSTVTWAVLCGVPVVLLDFYSERYNCYEHLTSIKTARTAADAGKLARTQLENVPDFSSDWRALSREDVFDGNTFRRYHEILSACSKSSLSIVHG